MKNSNYQEVTVSVYLNNNIRVIDMYEKLSRFINFSFNNSKLLSELHKNIGLKHYSYSGLYPIEQDSIYKADEIYSFIFRSYNNKIINEFITSMQTLENDDFIVTNVSTKRYKCKSIQFVDNLTPTIITLQDGIRWNKEIHGVEVAKESIFKNLMKKYNSLYNTSFDFKYEDVIKDISVKSKCAIIVNYKGVKFLGYKFRVEFQNNGIAQEIANISVVEGIGEKNSSFGMGFVKPYFRR